MHLRLSTMSKSQERYLSGALLQAWAWSSACGMGALKLLGLSFARNWFSSVKQSTGWRAWLFLIILMLQALQSNTSWCWPDSHTPPLRVCSIHHHHLAWSTCNILDISQHDDRHVLLCLRTHLASWILPSLLSLDILHSTCLHRYSK